MSGSNLSDSQDLSKSSSLQFGDDTSATETNSIFDSSATESSVTSRPPPETNMPNRTPEIEIPVINLSDEGSPTLNEESRPPGEDPSLDQDLGPNVPKVYENFTSAVVRFSSKYTDVSSIISFRRNTIITTLALDDSILIESCVPNEKVCDSFIAGDSTPLYTYLYDTLFTKLNFRLPFSDFEKGLLRLLNIPPSQLHPNSWAFVRAYQIMCHYYSLIPDLGKFFSFFQVKLPSSNELGWVSFKNIPKKGVITAYTSSYKLWKKKFFRVQGVNASSNLLFDSDGNPHFPLFWSLEPHKVPQTPLNLLSEEDQIVVEWLREQDPIECSSLLENEDNPAGLQTLLGNMPPKSQTTKTMDEVAMLKALRAREKKTKVAAATNNASVVNLVNDNNQGEEGNSGSRKNKKLMKESTQVLRIKVFPFLTLFKIPQALLRLIQFPGLPISGGLCLTILKELLMMSDRSLIVDSP